MTKHRNRSAKIPRREHTIPWFWPFAGAIELGEMGFKLLDENIKFLAEVRKIDYVDRALRPAWATANRIRLRLDTALLRDFSVRKKARDLVPVLIDPPYAGHASTIVDFARGQSLVEALRAAGVEHLLVTDWKSATESMKYFDIDKYLAEMNVIVDELGGNVHLVGLCQGGWLCAMFAARFPHKVRSLVLAGSPIDTNAGHGPIWKIAHDLPMTFFEGMVQLGSGRMLGSFMLAGWKSMHPEQHYVDKYLDLYAHIEDRNYVERTEAFERWYENPVDLPGTFYLQAIEALFKENRLASGTFTALGRKLDLRDIAVPVYLLAGESDDITMPAEVFRAEALVGTDARSVVKTLVPGGHIGLFMGRRTLTEAWPKIGRWILANDKLAGCKR